MKCISCGDVIPDDEPMRASISQFVCGDEYIYSYWLCRPCNVYTVEVYHDRFFGDDDVFFLAPMDRKTGDHCLQLIGTCPRPYDKNCGCEAHKALYRGVPDDTGD